MIILYMDYSPELRRFCVNDLAGILFRHIEHPMQPRDKIDWFTAEDFFDSTLTHGELFRLTGDFVGVSVYDYLQQRTSGLSEIKLNKYILEDYRPWLFSDLRDDNIINQLREKSTIMTRGYPHRFFFSLPEDQKDYYKGLFLGRFVWDKLYQRISNTSMFAKRGYGDITFR